MGNRLRPLAATLAVVFSSGVTAETLPSLGEVVVIAERQHDLPEPSVIGRQRLEPLRATTSDTASLLRDVPGVSLNSAGGTSSLPAIHGLADDRLRVSVDGMDLISSCPNHMNPPLSYVDPSAIGKIKVYAGIVPVSVGGDSIGGAVVVDTVSPRFAAPGQGLLTQGEIGGSVRSNNRAVAGNLSATAATENFSVSYTGTAAQAGNYKAGGNFKSTTATGRTGHTLPLDEVGSTAYENYSHLLGLAWRNANHLVEAKLGYQDAPYQYYPNQRMDMLDNEQQRGSLRYLGQFDWGNAEIRAYHEEVRHFMEFGPDKKFAYTAGNTTQGMPMRSKGMTTGASARFGIDLTPQDLLRVGGDYQHYRLNDWWPAVTGSMGMGPNDFININEGTRERAALFGEWEKRLSADWTTLLGARYEHVTSDAGLVHGYNTATAPLSVVGMDMMNQKADAVAFNNAGRRKTDRNWDLAALARYTVDASRDVEFGLSRKVRSPNLYERYTWSTANMMSIMNNFVGDGNGYVGNPNLKPETAYTASATFDWHAADRRWELKATPYYTFVDNYIDAVRCSSGSSGGCPTPTNTVGGRYVRLMYANQSARLYGIDISGRAPLASTGFGDFGIAGLVAYTRGTNEDTGDNLHNIMPLNAKLTLTHRSGGWSNAVEFITVQGKHDVSAVRNEVETSGYSLTHLRASYTWNRVRVDAGVENLFDRFYSLPTGGAYLGQGSTMSINPGDMPWGTVVPGMGRTFYAGLNVKF